MRKIKILFVTVGLLAFFFLGFQGSLTAQGDNIAKFKPAKQSSTLDYKSLAYRAVDGNTNGNWNTPSVIHTNLEHNAWWEVDLLDQYDITEIKLFNRTDAYRNRLSNFTISISDQPMEGNASSDSQFVSEKKSVDVSKIYKGRKTGRYVMIQLNDRSGGKRDYLHMAEVQIKGNLSKKLPRPNKNVALGKPARQSSVYNGWAEANLANDGNTAGSFHAGSVTATNADLGAWWQVDLGELHEVSEVILYNRTDEQSQRLSNFEIIYSETPINNSADGQVFGTYKDYPRIYLKCTAPNNKPVLARYIRVALKGRNNLSLAEVQVIGKLPGKIVEAPDPFYNYYWTYEKRENTGQEGYKTTITNTAENTAGYQLDESSSNSNELSLEYGASLGVSIKGILDISASWKVGTTLSNTRSTTNSSSAFEKISSDKTDEIPISAFSTVYYFTKWKETKNKVVVAYDGINWPYTATTDIKPAGEMAVFTYSVNDNIAQELKQYKVGVAIPEEVYQEIRNHNINYQRQKNETGGTVAGPGDTDQRTTTDNTSGGQVAQAKEVKFHSQNSLSLAEAQAIAKQNGWKMATSSEVEAAFQQKMLNVWAYGRMADGRFAVPVQQNQSNFKKGANIGVTGGNQGFFYTTSAIATSTNTSGGQVEDETYSSSNTSVTMVECVDGNGTPVGYFKDLEDGSNNWVETDTNGKTKFTYEVMDKEENAIHLYDNSRQVAICLELKLKQVLYSDSNNTSPFSIYTISNFKN